MGNVGPDDQTTGESPLAGGAMPHVVQLAASGAAHEQPSSSIGPYRLLEVIGEGGFGVVWLAERREPMVQRVALKIIKPGMDSRAVVARFEQERQALAVMDHPNVAKVFDGGVTDSGRPYFVMEYVKGDPITAFCDVHRYTIRQRLELFATVCEAVQHAHMKGIIHRDIKPSNILVEAADQGARVKVIDFGVAKAISHTLTDKTIYTERGQIIGTPEYMSPEQAEMGAIDIDTRTDVYSLGVVLYEMLCGSVPFDSKSLRAAGYAEIQRIIREDEAPRPSTRLSTIDDATGTAIAKARQAEREKIAGELKRELEWIPLMALRKDRARRYASAEALGADVRRYLEGEALEAGPESTAYRLRKLLKRHRGPTIAAAAVLLAIMLGLFGTITQAQRANRKAVNEAAARHVADQRTAEAEAERQKADDARRLADQRADEIDRNAYVASMQIASEYLYQNQFARLRERLAAAAKSKYRGWEWSWLSACADTSLTELNGHTDAVRFASFSPDGRRIVTASDDNTARMWDAVTGSLIATLNGHSLPVKSALFSPDGLRIVTASNDQTARVWDAATGSPLFELKGHSFPVFSASFSPDGAQIRTVANRGEEARIWDGTTGVLLAEINGHSLRPLSASFSPDGSRIVTESGDKTAKVWDVAKGATLVKLNGHSARVRSVSFGPGGQRIVTASNDTTARIWDAANGTCLVELKGHSGGISSALFNSDGLRIVTASSDKTARTWDAVTGAMLAEFKRHSEAISSASFSPDDRRILTMSNDKSAWIWDAASGAPLAELTGHASWLNSASFSPNGERVVTASSDNTARIWDAAMGTTPDSFEGHKMPVFSAAFSPDSSRIVTASGDNTARVWDLTTGAALTELKGHAFQVVDAEFSPDGRRILTASNDDTSRVWDTVSGRELVQLQGTEKAGFRSAGFSPDGMRIVTASAEKAARVWDAATGATLLVLNGHADRVRSAMYSPDGLRIVTASDDKTARVWDAVTGQSLLELKGHTDVINSAEYSPDSLRIVTTSDDKSVRVWDASTGHAVAELKDILPVGSASFSPDGSRLVISGNNGTSVRDSASGALLVELKGIGLSAGPGGFSPDGSRIVTASLDGTALVWNSVPYRERFPSIAAARNSRSRIEPLVKARFAAGETLEQIRASVATDHSIAEVDRTAYLAITQAMQDEQDNARARLLAESTSINATLWDLVKAPLPDTTPLSNAESRLARMLELAPDDPDLTNTAGVAFFRLDQYERALETLTKSDSLYVKNERGEQPANWAFIAMAHWRLGHKAEARAAAAKFRALAADDKWKADAEVLGWIKEVDAMITPE